MIARRSAGGIFDQRVISSTVRRQPVHRRASGWITQIRTQGLSISSRVQMSSSLNGLSSDAAIGPARLAEYTRPRRDL